MIPIDLTNINLAQIKQLHIQYIEENIYQNYYEMMNNGCYKGHMLDKKEKLFLNILFGQDEEKIKKKLLLYF